MSTFRQTLDLISKADPLHYKKIIKDLEGADDEFYLQADAFTDRYVKFLTRNGKTLEYGVECYLKLVDDIRKETVEFFHTGEYSSKSFDEVNQRIYSNPEVMEYYLNGLFISQFLWGHHYVILTYFVNNIVKFGKHQGRYLEIGGGHGLFISEAVRLLGGGVKFDLIDISAKSIEVARQVIENDSINYRQTDIFDLGDEDKNKYDFITMGEVLEHVEDPIALLTKIYGLLKEDGTMFITVPTNSPTLDHIYLFNNAEEIRQVIRAAGFEIADELCAYAEKGDLKKMEKYKVTMMYAAFLKKKI